MLVTLRQLALLGDVLVAVAAAGCVAAGTERPTDPGTAPAQGPGRATSERLPQPSDPVLDTAPSPAPRASPAPSAALQDCVDRELAKRGLNAFGDPPSTAYPGGPPVPPTSTDRFEYVLRRSPDIRTACEASAPFH